MTDHDAEPFTPAEARFASRLHDWSDRGVVAIDAGDIAMQAARTAPGGRVAATRSGILAGSGRRMLALVVLFLLAVGLLVAAAVALEEPTPEDAYRAVVVRQAAEGGVDVVLANTDGRERHLRHLVPADLGIDPRYALGIYSLGLALGQDGWLELWAVDGGEDRAGLAHFGLDVLVDLADPGRAPIAVLANGFMSGRWGPGGQWAHYCAGLQPPSLGHRSNASDSTVGLPDCGMPEGTEVGIDGSAVRVLRPDLGIASEIIVPYVQTFGGGPEIVWTADGSGFLGRRGSVWGVTPLDGGPFRPGVPRILHREMNPSRPELDDPGGWRVPGGESGLAPATPVTAQLTADGDGIWQLLDAGVDPPPRVLLARLTGPGALGSVRSYDLPEGQAAWWFTLSPDDTFVAIHLRTPDGAPWSFVFAPVGADASTVEAGPAIEGTLAGLVPVVTADTWAGS